MGSDIFSAMVAELPKIGFLDSLRELIDTKEIPDWVKNLPPLDIKLFPDNVRIAALFIKDFSDYSEVLKAGLNASNRNLYAIPLINFFYENNLAIRETEIENAFHQVIHWSVGGHSGVSHGSTIPPTLGDLRKVNLEELKKIDGLGTGYLAEIIKKLCPSST